MLLNDPLLQLPVALREAAVETGAQHGHRAPTILDRSCMSGGVDPLGQPADDDEAPAEEAAP